MLQLSRHGEVTRYDLARSLPGPWRYRTVAYLVDGMLVDTGCAHTAREFMTALQGESLHRIVNTHAHEDHIGANGLLQGQHEDLEILAHPLALPVLADPRRRLDLHPYRRLIWGWPRRSTARALPSGTSLETDQYSFQVIPTPGHSPDHVCLYEPEQGWLFTGDLFTGGWDRALPVDYDLWQIIDSLKLIAALPAERLFAGSARVRTNPASDLAAKIEYLEEIGTRVLELHARGWPVGRIARRLLGAPQFIELFTLGHFSRHGMVRSYLKRFG